MFHEMRTGSRPFTGESSPQLMASILRDVPASASEIRTEVPEALSRLIHRCLEKRPDDRVQTARDITCFTVAVLGLPPPACASRARVAAGRLRSGRRIGTLAAYMAAYVPAHRAARAEPLTALRHE
jgi:hypothetical protein